MATPFAARVPARSSRRPPLLAAAGKGILSAEEVQRLHRHRSASLDAVQWTVADTALIDEARTLLGPRRGGRPGRARAQRNEEALAQDVGFWPQGLAASPAPATSPGTGGDEEIRSFGHIVVDEVQDLSPMQLRMLARRSLSGSMTVVGDIAQATGPWAPAGWDDITRHLSPQRPPHLVELTVSYRTPAEVVALAAQVLAVAAPGVAPPRPVRQSGSTPRLVATTRAGLPSTLVELAREETAAVAPGRVAVLGPAVMLPELTRALDEAGLDPTDPRDPSGDGLAAGLVVLPADETNGLEFDSVIVVEPSLVAAVGDDTGGEGPPVATTRGLRTLYVAFTRPTKRLDRPARGTAPDRPALTRAFSPPTRGATPYLLVGASGTRSTRNCAVTQAVSAEVPAPQGKIVHDRPPMLAIGVMIWLGSELMFFSGLFAAFFTIRANTVGPWPPAGTELDVVRAGIFTLVLVSSSFTMQYAVYQAEWRRRRSARLWVIATIILGTAFLGNQFFEWLFSPTRWYTNSYGSLFYIMSGLHGLHVFIGLLAMTFFLGRMRGDKGGDPGELSAMQGISYYWHFVDIVWVGLYSCLFLLK